MDFLGHLAIGPRAKQLKCYGEVEEDDKLLLGLRHLTRRLRANILCRQTFETVQALADLLSTCDPNRLGFLLNFEAGWNHIDGVQVRGFQSSKTPCLMISTL